MKTWMKIEIEIIELISAIDQYTATTRAHRCSAWQTSLTCETTMISVVLYDVHKKIVELHKISLQPTIDEEAQARSFHLDDGDDDDRLSLTQ